MIGDFVSWVFDMIFEFAPMVAGVIIAIIIGAILWFAVMGDDDPSDRCRGELGYMGSVEYVECEL